MRIQDSLNHKIMTVRLGLNLAIFVLNMIQNHVLFLPTYNGASCTITEAVSDEFIHQRLNKLEFPCNLILDYHVAKSKLSLHIDERDVLIKFD